MPRKKVEKTNNSINNSIEEKLKYLGLDLEKIPKEFKKYKPLDFRIPKFYEEKQYKQYRYVPVKDIQILLSPTHRMDALEEKYKKAKPLADYLDDKSEDNILNYTMFLKMLEDFMPEEVDKIEKEQEMLSKKIPFRVKYENNYLWQIYYAENTDQYFMLVPTEDSDYSTFFYLLKKQIEKKRAAKIFVPIRNADYSDTYFQKSEFEDIENYLWLFTKDWPLIYEVYNKKNEPCIEIVGETEVYEKIKSQYRIKIDDKEKAVQFYRLLKAMFILQTELPNYFNFRTNIGKDGDIEFWIDDRKIEYKDIAEWIKDEYEVGENKLSEIEELIKADNEKLKNLKIEIASQEVEYLAKEKQISTFLECKKTFFGKFKYYFKYGKKKNSKKTSKDEEEKIINIEQEAQTDNEELPIKRKKVLKYNIEELLELYRIINDKENELKKIVMDVNSLKLKNKNMAKKIENATSYIAEIDSHKKSIFEFWKYSNKDEMSALPEGEEEEVNVIKKITKVFDYEEDFENFGISMDKVERANLSQEETDSVFITTTDLLPLLNKIKTNDFTPKDIESELKKLKKELSEQKTGQNEEYDIFGGIIQDSTKVTKIKDKKHRENPKDKLNILEISKNTKQLGFKMKLEKIINNVKEALNKVVITEEIPVYKAIIAEKENKIDKRKFNIFNINPEEELNSLIKEEKNKLVFYKINLPEGSNAIGYANCIFYDNKNRTLPEGQDLSTKILVDISKFELKLVKGFKFNILEFEDPKDDFSDINVKTINMIEYDAKNY